MKPWNMRMARALSRESITCNSGVHGAQKGAYPIYISAFPQCACGLESGDLMSRSYMYLYLPISKHFEISTRCMPVRVGHYLMCGGNVKYGLAQATPHDDV
jgi:hypothetical protein